MQELPRKLFSGDFTEGHVQGIAIDLENRHAYYSFTTLLVKTDFEGNLIGSVKRLAGHLGCITFDADRRKIYGSLELKHDSIGADIIKRTGWDPTNEDAFYLVEFDCDAITRSEMDAETDGVMRAVYLKEPSRDYAEIDEASGKKHRYGCSGIDGTAYGVGFGDTADKKITVCYGIYSDTERADNDYQVILEYEPDVFDVYGRELVQSDPHHSGPEKADEKYFLYTGNTRWGVQNFEYDAYTDSYFVAVYKGAKKEFPNYPMFVIDRKKAPILQEFKGRNGEMGLVLTLARVGSKKNTSAEVTGVDFPYGSTGFFACGDGRYYISHPHHRASDKTHSCIAHLYELCDYDEMFELV